MISYNYIVDVFKRIVVDVSNTPIVKQKLLTMYPASNGEIQFMHGHPVELVKTLNSMVQGELCGIIKYPAILLFQDFEERLVNNRYYEADLHLVIANSTIQSLIASERYEKNFKPLLNPIYQIFIDKVARKNATYDLKVRKIDRLFWGQTGLSYYDDGGTKNVFNDYLDAIEVFLTFKYSIKNCEAFQSSLIDCNAQN